MEENLYRNIISQLDAITKIAREKEAGFLRNIVTISVGFLGIIVSLSDTDKMGNLKHFCFSMLTTLLVLAILCSLIFLYGEVRVINRIDSLILTDVNKQLEENTSIARKYVANDKPYDLLKTAALVFYISSLLVLVLFSWA